MHIDFRKASVPEPVKAGSTLTGSTHDRYFVVTSVLQLQLRDYHLLWGTDRKPRQQAVGPLEKSGHPQSQGAVNK